MEAVLPSWIVRLYPKKAIFFLIYIPVFFWEMIKANFDVAYRVIHPRMPIRPGVEPDPEPV